MLISRARHEREIAELKAEANRLRGEQDKALKARDTAVFNRQQAIEQNTKLDAELAAAHKRLAAYGGRRSVPDVLEEHDVHRKALADALGDQRRHLNWDQLIADVVRLHKAAAAWRADYEAEKLRAEQLEGPVNEADSKIASEWGARVRAHDRWKSCPGGEGLIEGGSRRPTHPAVELRRTQERCRALEARLALAEGRPRTVSGL